jgi:nitrate/nitrite transporter NarK
MAVDSDISEPERNHRDSGGKISPNTTIIIQYKEVKHNKYSLRFRYLFCYLIVRGSIWSKAPYLFILYLNYHKFSVSEIGLLFVIDYLSSLIFSPFIGGLTDVYGRKLFSIIYNLLVITNLILRLTGVQSLAYLAQLLTGIGTGIVNTSYESWIVCESHKVFEESAIRQRFLKKIFKK